MNVHPVEITVGNYEPVLGNLMSIHQGVVHWPGDKFLQVPVAVVDTMVKVITVPLQQYLLTVKIIDRYDLTLADIERINQGE